MSSPKKQDSSVWADHKTELILGILGVCAAVVLFIFSYPAYLSPSDTIQSITLILLVIVTISYAKSTHKNYKATSEQVSATMEAVRVAVDSERNSFAPIVELTQESNDPRFGEGISIICTNVGKGPALNLVIWVTADDEKFDYLKSDREKQMSFRSALGVSRSARQLWSENMDVAPPRPLPTESSGYDVVAEYTDVYRRRFQSKIVFSSLEQSFHYGLIESDMETTNEPI